MFSDYLYEKIISDITDICRVSVQYESSIVRTLSLQQLRT